MPSCSASSNIRTTIINNTSNHTSGSRIFFTITTASGQGYTIETGITAGSVIRYDPTIEEYVLSKADTPANAEVVGVVESYTVSSGDTVFTVVSHGLINYPEPLNSLPEKYLSCTPEGADGGLGGNDIFFLSDDCPGKIQKKEPNVGGAIVKPIIQQIKLPNYNGIVLNYIGYEIGTEAFAELAQTDVAGNIAYLAEASAVPESYLDISSPREVSKSENPELYTIFQTNYGNYYEQITMIDPPIPGWINSTLNQFISGALTSTGKITEVNVAKQKITVKKLYNQPLIDSNYPIIINGSGYKIQSSEVIKFTVPSVPSPSINFQTDENSTAATLKPCIRAKSDRSFVSIPSRLYLAGLSLGSINDVEDTINYICTELASHIPGFNCP